MKKLKMIGMLFVMLFLVGILPTKAHAEGWVQEENGSWYYLNQAGEKAKETWIGNYYVDENGVWIEGKTQAKMSGSAAVVVGGIVTVTEDIPDQAGNRSTEPGIILTVQDGWRPAG